MAKKKYTDSEILDAMTMHLDYDPVVFGASGHYGVGAQYNLNKDYKVAEETKAAEKWKESVNEDMQDAYWMAEY